MMNLKTLDLIGFIALDSANVKPIQLANNSSSTTSRQHQAVSDVATTNILQPYNLIT